MDPAHVDVLVVGAGISGIAAGHYLTRRCPGRSFRILEARAALGGTWDLFRYPGIRADSDMYTLGYSFRPWTGRAIADGDEILAYLRETARETGVDGAIRYGRRVQAARWSTATRRWTVEVLDTETGATREQTCGFLFCCTGYYRYDHGYTPEFPGVDLFRGRVVHPQRWPADLDTTGKRVVVIGSGATAMTLVPALAARGARVTLLQRTPTWVLSLPRVDRSAAWLQDHLPAGSASRVIRAKHVLLSRASYRAARRFPAATARFLLRGVRSVLGDREDLDRHFRPPYAPWDQRLCILPEGDLLHAIAEGGVEMVTDHVETFTEDGVQLRSGARLEADVVVTATGLELQFFGGAALEIDGRPVDPARTLLYRGVMACGVPNLGVLLGYTNASWTLKCELACRYLCRVLRFMDRRGYTMCVPREGDPAMPTRPGFDLDAGYVRRALGGMPRQGNRDPWRVHNDYLRDLVTLRAARPDDGVLEFR